MANGNLLCQIRWIDCGVLLKELIVVVARQPVLVIGRSQDCPLEISAGLAFSDQTGAVIVEALISIYANATLLTIIPVRTFALYERD
jgi:hypothetical protein